MEDRNIRTRDSILSQEDNEVNHYRFGMGLDIVDQNIINAYEIERAVNNEQPEDDEEPKK